MSIGVTAKLTIQDGKNSEFEAIFKRLADAVNAKEDGCDFYHLYQMRGEQNVYMVLEQYTDNDALVAHQQTEHYISIGAELGQVLAAKPDVKLMDSV